LLLLEGAAVHPGRAQAGFSLVLALELDGSLSRRAEGPGRRSGGGSLVRASRGGWPVDVLQGHVGPSKDRDQLTAGTVSAPAMSAACPGKESRALGASHREKACPEPRGDLIFKK